MNAPEQVTVWVCDECGYWRQDKTTGIHMATNPADPNGRDLRHELREAVYAAAPYERTLLVAYDVTGLPQHEIDALAFEAEVQSETSDEYTEDEPGTGHRGVESTAVEVGR